MIKVDVLYEHTNDDEPHGCSHIRLLRPLAHPRNERRLLMRARRSFQPGADVVIVERFWRPRSITLADAERLVRAVRQAGATLIYTLDDNLLDLEITRRTTPKAPVSLSTIVRFLAREADGIIVSTEPLRRRMERLNPRIAVVENAVDERLFRPGPEHRPTPGQDKVIGFMGTYTHDLDLMMVLQPLREVRRADPGRVRLELVGGVADAAVLRAFDGLLVRRLEPSSHQYPDFIEWLRANATWDLAIAPLEDTPFTRCKSDLKFLDYSALGIPGVFSRVPSYESTVRHLETGYLAENTPEAWSTGLRQLLDDDALRRRIAANARRFVSEHRTLAICAGRWVDAVMEIVQARPSSAIARAS
jgi:processive 1,2-diacylglycerol beta-glucosyltransferase